MGSNDEITWFHCVRCREEGVTKARQMALADMAKRQDLAAAITSAKQVCGWMHRPCRHKAHCQPVQPTPLVLELWNEHRTPTSQERVQRAPVDIQETCRRMEQIAAQVEHVRASQEYDDRKQEQEEREYANWLRSKAIQRDQSIKKAKERARAYRAKQLAKGLVEARAADLGPLNRQDFEIDMAPHVRGLTWEHVKDCSQSEMRYAIDLLREMRGCPRTIPFVFEQVRRFRKGLVRVWLLPEEAEQCPHLLVDAAGGDEDAFVAFDEQVNDMPMDYYDAGDSAAWKRKQKDASWAQRAKARQGDAKIGVGDLLKGIGR